MRRTGLTLLLALAAALTASAQTQAPNTIATYAGGGTNTGAASSADLPRPILAIRDTAGNTYISVPALGIIYKVAAGSGTISIFAGNGILGFSGDGGAATSAQLDYPEGMAFDSSGNLYIADVENNRIRRVTPSGTITTVAGTGAEYNGAGFFGGYSGDGGIATEAFLNQPSDVAFDSTGNMYIADSLNNVVRVVNGSGVINTFAGNGTAGYGGDNAAAASAELNFPVSVTTDTTGNVYISDQGNCIVRKVDTSASHIITTYAGTPQTCGYGGDGAAATSALMRKPSAVRTDSTNNLFIADENNNRIRKVDNTTAHDITTVVGTGAACATPSGCGDGGSPTSALLNWPLGVSVDSSGNILVTDSGDARVRVVSAGSSPTITAFAGGGTGGDGGAATSAVLGLPYITALDSSGNLYITDTFGLRIREVNAKTHAISTFAGNGVRGVPGQANGDGGAATSAQFIHPTGLAFDSQGNLYVVDSEAYVVRKISTTGTISTVLGNGQQCNATGNPNTFPACGDGSSPTSASLFIPEAVAFDGSGNLYISDAGLNRIRVVTNGVISNFAGNADNNTCATSTAACGDGGPATSALLNSPFGIAFDAQGNLDIVDGGDNRIRQVSSGTISTIAFTGEPTFGGDGGDPTSASMFQPTEIAIDPNFNIFLSGGFDNVVRRIDALNFDGFVEYDSTATVAGDVDNLDGGYNGDGGPATKALLSNFGLSVDSNQNLYIADAGNNRIRIVPMAPVAAWEPTSLTNFGTLLAGQLASDSQDIIFTNSGLDSLTVTLQSPLTDFSVSDCSSEPAPPEGECLVSVAFTPPAGVPAGPVTANVVLLTNDPNHPTLTFPVAGTISTTAVALTVSISGSGNVSSTTGNIECPVSSCTANFASGTTVTLTAFGSSGYGFSGWSANCTPVANTPYECTIVMSQAATVTATFGAPTLSVASGGNGSGTISSSPAGINCTVTNGVSSGTCTAAFPVGTSTVTLSGTPTSGSTFVGWSASFCSPESPTNECQVTPSSFLSFTATAIFSVPRKAFTKGDVFVGTESNMIWEYSSAGALVQVLPSISGNEFDGFVYGMIFDNNGTLYAASPNAATASAGVETFTSNGAGPTAFGGTSTETAGAVRVDALGDVFVGLEVNGTSGDLLEFAPGNTTSPTAAFYPAYYGSNGIFAFELAQDDVTVYYTAGGTSIYSYNTQLGLQNPDVTDTLPGLYAGDLRQLPDTTLLVADGDRIVRVNSTTGAVTQTYTPSGVELLLGLTLDPDGTDFWTDDSITGIVYKINIASGTVVSQFNTNLGLNANFGLIGVGGVAVYGSQQSGGDDLTVDITGLGSGSVSSTPAGISCPPTCTANFVPNTQVTLTETPGTGATFGGWSGACSGTGSCVVTMSAAEVVTATFNTSSFALTVTTAGSGTGTVTGQTSPQINCTTGSTAGCTQSYPGGTVVTLTATPASGSAFTGWSGNAACSGTGTCTITMSAAESVTATFNTAAAVTINVDILNNGSSGVGTVTDNTGTGGINCTTTSGQGQTGTCSASYPANSTVTFTETPGAGSVFTGWQDQTCQTGGNPNQCTVTVTTNGSLFANFGNGTGTFTLTVALPSNLSNSTGGGSVSSGVTGGGIANCTFNGTNPLTGTCSNSAEKSGAVLELIPVPTDNSTFGGYAGTCPSQVGNNCFVTMSQNQTVTPVFTAAQLTLTVSITGNGSLVDTANTGKINCSSTNGTQSGTCTATYTAGTSATLTETPGTGYTFTQFGGSPCQVTATTCTLTFNVGNTYSVSAIFTINTYLLNMSTLGGSGTGTVTSNANNLGGTINCGPNNQPPNGCGLEEQYNWPITLTATPTSGSTFAGWAASGATGFTLPCTTNPTCSFNMPVSQISGLSVTATFNKSTTFALTVTEAGTGTGTVTSNSQPQIVCPSTCSANIASGTVVTLTAAPNSGSTFAGWSGNAACSGTGTCTITMSAAESVTATFNTTTTFPLTVTEAGTGTGTVSSNTGGILCPSTCSASIASGTQVTLTATPNSGSTFAGWSGNAACSGTGNCTITMSAAESVTATFNTAATFPLTVTIIQNALNEGSVASTNVTGISCPSACTANFTSGQQVTLAATANAGSKFTGWSGNAACSGTGSCTITMSAAESVTANFTAQQFALTVTDSGTGTGTVTSSSSVQPQINCTTGSTAGCTANYNSGTLITLNASPASGSTFAGWTGQSGCGSSGSCTIDMTAAESVTATFNTSASPTLTVVLAGTGTGSVSFTSSSTYTCSNTTGVVTGTCSASFPSGTVVNASEIPGTGSVFAGWSGGGCSGTGSTCNVTLTASTTVTATFNKPTFALTVTDAGTGTGTVTSSSSVQPQINCTTGSSTGCTANYSSGTLVTLNASPASGSTFAGWSEQSGCGGTGSCTVNMTAAESVTATFTKVQYALTVSLAGTGSGSVTSTPQGINCGSGCTADFNSGSQVTLTAAAGDGSAFASWSGNCAPVPTNALQCTITMNAAATVTATFNTGANFTFAPTTGTATTVTTNPGGNIVVGLTVSGPVKETINLGCTSNAPQFLTCVITPTTVNLTGNGTTQVAIVLKSYCQGATPGLPGDSPSRPIPPAGILGLLGLATLLIGGMWSRGDRRRFALTMAAMLVMAVTGAACGNLPQGPNGATPAGNYVLTVTAAAAGQPTQSVQINVQVN